MKKQILLAAFFAFCLVSPQKVLAARFSQFYVFGDSLSDTGNIFNVTRGQVPDPVAKSGQSAYSNGRFSNGPIWVDYFGDQVGLKPIQSSVLFANPSVFPQQGINFAFGNAQTGNNVPIAGTNFSIPSVRTQVDDFARLTPVADPNAIYSVWGGPNDYFQGNLNVQEVVGNLSQSVSTLVGKGAKNIVVSNLPDLGRIPLSVSSGRTSQLSRLTTEHNRQLEIALNDIRAKNPGVNIYSVDISSLFKTILAQPSRFGLTDVEKPCIEGNTLEVISVCPNPNEIAFFDGIHPNSKVHNFIAQKTLATIEGRSIPEPSVAMGMLGFGFVAFVGSRKKKSETVSNLSASK